MSETAITNDGASPGGSDRTPPRVPMRLVLYSIAGLWLCYFIVATIRSGVMGLDLSLAMLSRRMAVVVASMAITALFWPLLLALARRPLWVQAAAVCVAALPGSLLLATVNLAAFADMDGAKTVTDIKTGNGVSIRKDATGGIFIEVPSPPIPPVSPMPAIPSGATEREIERQVEAHAREIEKQAEAQERVAEKLAEAHERIAEKQAEAEERKIEQQVEKSVEEAIAKRHGNPGAVSIQTSHQKDDWAEIVELAFGRYFLLLAWAAVYLALVKAEEAGAAERREGEFRRAAQASELRSLRYQINPHFLFNTLNSLSALVMTGKPEAAERMIQTLSAFYRRSLVGDPTGDVPLAEEIALQRLYLDIEAVRFPERLRVAIDVPETLGDVLVPGMILQPLVENSVKYAVAASSKPVTVAVTARAEGDDLVLTVSDDGPGLPGMGKGADGCGIGLTNVRDRVLARFGPAASLTVGPLPDGGYRTTIRLPLLRRTGIDYRS